MRKHWWIRILFAAMVFTVWAHTDRAYANVETWTSQAGTQIQASFLELSDDGMVALRSRDGEQFQIAVTALDNAGQERVRELARKQQDARLAEVRSTVRQLRAIVPEAFIASGDKVLGRFESRNLTGIVYEPSGHMDLFIKENGQYLSPPVRFNIAVRYNMPDPSRPSSTVRRTRARVEWSAPPEYSNNTARFRMRMEHGVEAELVYTFRSDGVDTSYQVVDPAGIQHPSDRSHMRLVFPAIFHEDRRASPPRYYSPRFPEGTDRETFFARTEKFEVRSGTGPRASGRRIPFNQRIRSVGRGEWFEIGGGAYGLHTLRVERPRRGGSLTTYIYQDNIIAQGWTMYFNRTGHAGAIQAADMLRVTVGR